MTIKRIFFYSFLITLLVWLCFSWPLPRYVTAGIPAAAHLEPAVVQTMLPGDHLQFMYYCWLAGDMLFGKTPLFCNLYEFNIGEASAKPSEAVHAPEGEKRSGYRPDAYYFPFSLVYSVFALAGGRALGWNLTGVLSLWLTYFLTWLLVRRYAKPDWLAAGAALIAITLPFRWINLCGGSPAGFAMMWIPAIFLGIDRASRDGSPAGGWLAGLSILLASWTDNHIFFFGTLAAPGWAVIAIAAGARQTATRQISWQNIFIALLPIPLCAAGALAFPALMQQIAGGAVDQHLGAAVAARTFREIALYSPSRNGFFSWFSTGVSSHIYLGFAALAFLSAGWAGLFIHSLRGRNGAWRRWLIMTLLIFAVIGIMALALGTNGPQQAVCLRIARKIIPPYAMIRQPAKIFCLLPTLLAVATGLGLSAIFLQLKTTPAKIAAALLFGGALGAEYAQRVHPTISILDANQGAYAAVATDAALAGQPAHVLIIPLWPGDSHYSSVYQYYASLYRVKMVNGYNPFVSKSYFDNVFRRYESVNQGWLAGDQLDELLRRGIDYLILHEDLFPEKVSPFPVGWTLRHFLRHPRLELLQQAGRVWAFKLLPKPDEAGSLLAKAGRADSKKDGAAGGRRPTLMHRKFPPEADPPSVDKTGRDGSPSRPILESRMPRRDIPTLTARPVGRERPRFAATLESSDVTFETDPWSPFGSARHWPAEGCLRGAARIRRDKSPAQAAYALLAAPGAALLFPSQRMAAAALNWMLRARGAGTIIARTMIDGKPLSADLVDIAEEEWTWVCIPLPNPGVFAPLSLKLEWENGAVDCDQLLLAAGEWVPPAAGRTVILPAPGMFHAGYTSLPDNAVVLEKDRDPAALVFYGPKLPLEKGKYRIELVFRSAAPRGRLLGQFNIKRHARDFILNWIPVIAGARSLTEFTQPVNEPMQLEFLFLGNADIEINSIKLTRLE